MKKIIITIAVVFAVCCALFASDPEVISYSDLKPDGKIKAFIDEYTDGTPVEVYVSEVDYVSEIVFFNYKNDYGETQETVIIVYDDGSVGGIDCSDYSVTMHYMSMLTVPEEDMPDVLMTINMINRYATDTMNTGTLYVDEDGYLSSVFNIYLDGVTDMAWFLFWNYWDFEYSSRTMIDYIGAY